MKSSNPKQVLILSIVAVGAVGYLGSTLLNVGKSTATGMASSTEREALAENSVAMNSDLLRDPFAHPKLIDAARRVAQQSDVQEPSEPISEPTPAPLPLPGKGFSPAAPLQVQPESGDEKPAESAGSNRNDKEAQGPKVALSAIVKVDREVAFLSIDGGESRPYREGSLVAPGVQLVSIAASSVKFRFAGKIVEVKIGEEASL